MVPKLINATNRHLTADLRLPIALLVNGNCDHITYRSRDIFAYTEVENRHFRTLHSNCSPLAGERQAIST